MWGEKKRKSWQKVRDRCRGLPREDLWSSPVDCEYTLLFSLCLATC